VADDQGMALIAMILLATVMSMIAAVIIVDSTSELRRSTVQVDKTSALQAAQAGIDDYEAKISQDSLYYFHWVHSAEPLRAGSTGSGAYLWKGGTAWTYDTTRRWVPLGSSGFEYSIRITPPSATSKILSIVSTGRKVNDTNVANWRAIETQGRGSSVASFQTLANGNLVFDNGSITTGPIYASGNINHGGIAYGDLYAEGSVNNGVDLRSPGAGMPVAIAYDSSSTPDIRTQIAQPVDFTTFTTAISTIRVVAAATCSPTPPTACGIVLDDPTVASWKVFFHTDGTSVGKVDVAKCAAAQENSSTPPACGVVTTQDVPAMGTIYVGQDVVVSGVVQGQVSVASNSDMYIGGDITYKTVGEDIIGLIARGDVIVPSFATTAPNDDVLYWYSATVSQTGLMREGTSAGGHKTWYFYGAVTATDQAGLITPTFQGTHTFSYDATLIYLQPPFFPVISTNYQLLLFREITPTA
jgi:hypothetical protein